eukprot:CAMPEP_0168612218 /NCGR_PEP_ID=MMETSP0449_2-20121227/2790_1 /TAXON_ID=1082188 /ORGANISM="Strombidium rassoulzadegani, Strain ras09" /LENGTH=86 /DNA_ID=CAMNT_0008652749 /DNA_START=84 /DNA_END=345 /DNA_ORIENTATION=-
MPLVLLEGEWSLQHLVSRATSGSDERDDGEAEKNKTAPNDTEGSTEGTPTADVYRLWLKESSPIGETMERGQDSTEEEMRPPFKLF